MNKLNLNSFLTKSQVGWVKAKRCPPLPLVTDSLDGWQNGV
jgi:hypothetical protein